MIEEIHKLEKSLKAFQEEENEKTADQLLVDIRNIQPWIEEFKMRCNEIIDKAGETEHFKSYGTYETRNLKINAVKKVLEENGLMSPDLFVINSFLMIRRKKEAAR